MFAVLFAENAAFILTPIIWFTLFNLVTKDEDKGGWLPAALILFPISFVLAGFAGIILSVIFTGSTVG